MEDLLSAEGWALRGSESTAEDFDGVVRQHQGRIFRVLVGMLRDADAAETLVQETFLRAYQHRGGFRGEGSLEGWLVRIAMNLARDHVRNRRAGFWRRLLGGDQGEIASQSARDPQANPERQLLAKEQAAAVWQIAEELSPQQRAVFVLRFVEDMPLEQIARVTRLRVGTVKAHLNRAVVKLRQRLREREE